MKTLAELKADLADINANIARGEKFLADGCDCGMMLEVTKAIKVEVAREIAELEAQQ